MYPKRTDSQELKKEIKFNESVDKQMKQIKDFGVAFKKTASDSVGALHLIPIHTITTRTRQCVDYKKLGLFLLAFVVGAVLLVLLLSSQHRRPNPQDSDISTEHWNTIHSESKESPIVMGLVEETTTTTTTTTPTPESTTRRELDHILASITVINATVPQMDRTIFSKRADAYVDLYVIDGTRHRKVGRSSPDKNTLAPKWNYMFEHQMPLKPDTILNFELYDSDKFNMDELIGRLYVKVNDVIADESSNGQIVSRDYGSGRLWFMIHWKPVYKYI